MTDGSLGYFKDRKGKYQVKGVYAVMPFWGMKIPAESSVMTPPDNDR